MLTDNIGHYRLLDEGDPSPHWYDPLPGTDVPENETLTLLEQQLLETHGLDIGFDGAVIGSQDAIAGDFDFEYPQGVKALIQEIERICITPLGSLVDDPSYGIDLSMIGMANDLRVTIGLTRLAFVNALSHSSFTGRFRLAGLDVDWDATQPTALTVTGFLEVFGYGGFSFAQVLDLDNS